MGRQQDWTILTRATLLARLKDIDDHESWTEFYDIYSRLIYHVAKQRGLTGHEAEEVVVETIAAAARHMPDFNYDRSRGSFKTWLLQMARWRILDQYKKRQRNIVEHSVNGSKVEGLADTDLDHPLAGADLEHTWDEEWQRCLLEKATETVRRQHNPKQYQAYDLYVKKEWSADRVAQFLSIRRNQVYLSKHRVTEAIMAEVQRLRDEII